MTKEFLSAVLGDTGYYCVVGLKQLESKTIQKFYDTIDEAVEAAYKLSDDEFDAYYGLATFADNKSRKNDNVAQLHSLFLDLDCGAGKDYETQSDAIEGLRNFCKKLKFPKPMLINSGRGIHVYWPLTESVTRDVWLPVAEKLKAACRLHKLHADPAVTADAARILRVPGTLNYKDNPPKEVKMLGPMVEPVELGVIADLLDDPALGGKKPYVPREMDPLTQMLAGSYTSRFKTILTKIQAGRGCAQLEKVVTEQETISEPMWRAGLSIAAFCIDKDKAVHFISNKHEEYTPERTEAKVAMIKGPYTCAKFEEYNPGGCAECPHNGKIKSPISLGREVIEATEEDNLIVLPPAPSTPTAPSQSYQIPKLPHPYFRGKNGGIFAHAKNKAGDDVEILIYHNDLYALRRIRDQILGESLMLRLHLPKDGVRDFTVPLTAILAKDEFRRHFAAQGVAAMNLDGLMEYTTKWVNHLQMQTVADDARTQYGWTGEVSNPKSFVIGEQEIFEDRIELNPVSGKTASTYAYFLPRGTLDGWKQAIGFLNQPNFELHQYMFGVAFGSPLMFFTPINGAMFHAYSKDSGLGKTTAMLAGASVWGNPDELVLFEKDTVNTKMNRAEVYRHLPLYLDEMTNTHPKDLSDFGYQLPSGKQRNRLGQNGNTERYRGLPWKLSSASTGNTSMIERISGYKALPKAEAARILEYRAVKTFFGDKTLTDKFSNEIKQHWGHAGPVYIQYILKNYESVIELLASVQQSFDKAADLASADRFWSAHCATTLTGLMIAKRIGLIDFDIKAITKWLLGVVESAKRGLESMSGDPEAILTDYLAEHYTSVLRIKSTDDARGKTTDIDHLIIPDASPRMAMVARYEYDIKKMYLMPTPLKQWCVKHQINYSGFIDGLKRGRTKAKYDTKRMGKGTRMNLPPSPVIVIDCSEFMNDDTEDNLAAGANEKEAHEDQE